MPQSNRKPATMRKLKEAAVEGRPSIFEVVGDIMQPIVNVGQTGDYGISKSPDLAKRKAKVFAATNFLDSPRFSLRRKGSETQQLKHIKSEVPQAPRQSGVKLS